MSTIKVERTDTERLDWLEKYGVEIYDTLSDRVGLKHVGGNGALSRAVGDTLREAIDAAMDATPEPEEEG